MVGFHAPIIGIIPGIMALGVMGKGLSLIPKGLGGTAKQGKSLIKGFATIVVGTALIKPVANIAAGF